MHTAYIYKYAIRYIPMHLGLGISIHITTYIDIKHGYTKHSTQKFLRSLHLGNSSWGDLGVWQPWSTLLAGSVLDLIGIYHGIPFVKREKYGPGFLSMGHEYTCKPSIGAIPCYTLFMTHLPLTNPISRRELSFTSNEHGGSLYTRNEEFKTSPSKRPDTFCWNHRLGWRCSNPRP